MRPSFITGRKESTRSTHKTILLVCEGERTEPSYFKGFRLHGSKIEIVGTGMNTYSLVMEAIRLNNEGSYNEVWCVFDRDSFPQRNINRAFQLIEKFGFKHAFSSEAFELWYLLHFDYLDARISRQDYCKRLSDKLKSDYRKNDPDMYNKMLNKQATAIRNARKLFLAMTKDNQKVEKAIPVTTIHLLVERMNKFIKINRSIK